MSDSWEKRSIPNVRGWNNYAPSGPSFSVSYNSTTDELTITSSQPVFDQTNAANATTDLGAVSFSGGTLQVGSPTLLVIPNYRATVGGDHSLQQIDFYDTLAALQGIWTGPAAIVGAPAGVADIQDAQSIAPDQLYLSGVNFNTAERFRVISDTPPGSYDAYYYDSAGPNAGLNPAGAVVTVFNGGTSVTIDDAALDGQTIDYIQARGVGDAVVDQWYGAVAIMGAVDPNSYPSITRGYSPEPNRFVLEGRRFETATMGALYNITLRYADPNNDGRLNTFYKPPIGHPANPDNVPNGPGITINAWTDELVDITDTNFTDVGASFPADMPFVVTGAAMHDFTGGATPGYGYYYHEDQVKTGPFAVDGTGVGPDLGPITGAPYDDPNGSHNEIGYFGGGNHDIGIFGANFASAAGGQVEFADVWHDVAGTPTFLARWYRFGSPNVGDNPAGSSQSGTFDGPGTCFQFGAPLLAGKTILGATLQDVNGNYVATAVANPPLHVPN